MFNSNVLEVGVGLIFTFLAVSLITGAIVETIASAVGWRANTLLNGVKALLNDPAFSSLARNLYGHAAINPRGPGAPAGGGTAPTGPWSRFTLAGRHILSTKDKPSYIDKDQFANAFMDVIKMSQAVPAAAAATTPAAAVTALKDAITIADPQIEGLVEGIIDKSLGNVEQIKKELAAWFDNGMERLSGVYKRWTQLLSFLIALILSFLLNVDSITISKAVWEQPSLVENLKPPANASSSSGTSPDRLKNADDTLKLLDRYLPVGWPNGFFVTGNKTDYPAKNRDGSPRTDSAGKALYEFTPGDYWVAFFGWLITAIATLFGAPFWFDALQSITRLKGTGPSPDEKRTGRAAAT